MALAITSSLTALQRGFASIDSARNMVIAGQIMQSEIEKMRVCPWTTTATVTGIVDYTNDTPAIAIDPNFAADNPTIANRFVVTRTITTTATEMRQITLNVSWTNYDGRRLSRNYTFFYARYGLYDFFSS